jgi:predicted alpha/beta-hydrolase family hydrolase
VTGSDGPGAAPTPFHEAAAGAPPVHGLLHRPAGAARAGLVLAHGAGSSASSPLLAALAAAFAARGVAVLRCDLPFRQARPHGPPAPGSAPRDQAGLRAAVAALGRSGVRPVWLGGHSYGGRQATLLAAEDPRVTPALLLLAYPLHPPGRPAPLRVDHFPRLRTPALFVHGTRDPFGSEPELRAALHLVAAPAVLQLEAGLGHDLGAARGARPPVLALAARVAERWLALRA